MAAGYSTKGAPTNGSVYVSNLPLGTDENMLAEYFGTIGLLKRDKRTGTPKVWLYRDKETDEPKGDATVTYEDPHAALAAVDWFNNKDFHGSVIGVFMAESKSKSGGGGGDYPSEGFGFDGGGAIASSKETNGRGRGGQGDSSAKPWQQDGDWMCPNTSCTNVNFAFRGVCNRCGTARPAGASGGSMGGGGRGRGRGGGADGGPPGKGASTGLFGPNDWSCPMCGNVNWAKRLKCNVCNTNKPGQNEGGVRGGRGGGYKELDEQELEETKRRRREAEEDDGEMYDEFGNLKKKYRVKTNQADARPAVAAGRAGWEVEELAFSFLRSLRHHSRSQGLKGVSLRSRRHQSISVAINRVVECFNRSRRRGLQHLRFSVSTSRFLISGVSSLSSGSNSLLSLPIWVSSIVEDLSGFSKRTTHLFLFSSDLATDTMDFQSLETIAALDAAMDAGNEYIEAVDAMDAVGEEEPHAPTLSVTQPLQPVRKKRAKCWEDFTHVGLEADGKERARCNHCGLKMVAERKNGTSSLSRHADRCPDKLRSDVPKYDHMADREKMSEVIIYHDLPFKYVEYEKVRERDRFLNPDVQHISRQIAASDVYKRYEIEKAKLIAVLVKHKGRVCFTADLWTARSVVMGYICITAHYIDENWRLNNKILAFCSIKPPHTGEVIARAVYDCLKEWGLERKVFTITLDNAKANDSMLNILKHRLLSSNGGSNGLLCNGKFMHVRCSAHILNLIVKAGLELATSLIENIRETVKFIKASESRKDSFAICVESARVTSSAGLSLDVSTRWNSTYEMLVRALKFRKAFAILNLYERGYKWLPSEAEWERGVKICSLLKPFNTITTYFSGVKYPTASVYFIQVWKIEKVLMKYSDCDDVDLSTMVRAMRKKFAKYWNQYSVVLAMAAALDPRLKLDIVQSAYESIDPRTAEAKVQVVRDNLVLLYEEYHKSANPSRFSASLTPHELLTESPLEDDMDDDLFELENSLKSSSRNAKSNLETYLDVEPRLEMKTFEDIEVLSFWKENQHRYGDLASMASDLLSIPITTVAAESAFSVGGRVLTPFRNRLLPKNVQALIATRNWLRGFADFEGDIEDFFSDEDDDAAKSNSEVGDSSA